MIDSMVCDSKYFKDIDIWIHCTDNIKYKHGISRLNKMLAYLTISITCVDVMCYKSE